MDDFNPLVSIIIPVYNGSNYMKEAIDSALAQTYNNIEVIVVNDGSTDNTDEIAHSYGDKIRYFEKENGGVATALNLAIQNAKGEYISWLSHDDVYFENKIEAQIKELEKLKDKNTILYSNYICINEKSQYLKSVQIQNDFNKDKLENTLYPVMFGLISGCTLLIPKICFDKVGYFDTSLRTTQDNALWYKMIQKFNLHFVNYELIKERIHAEQGSRIECTHPTERTQLWRNIIETISNDEIDKMYNSRMEFWLEISKHFRLHSLNELQIKVLRKIVCITPKKTNTLITTFIKIKRDGLRKFIKDIGLFARLVLSCAILIVKPLINKLFDIIFKLFK